MTQLKLSTVVASPPREADFIYQTLPGPYPRVCKSMLRHVGTIERQGSRGKCTGASTTTVAEFFMTRAGLPIELAPDFNYDFTRAFELRRGQPGAQLRDAVDTLRRWGAPKVELYPSVYDDELTRDPTFECLLDAAGCRLDRYEVVTVRGSQWVGIDEIKAAVQSAIMERCPLVIAMPVTRSIYDMVGPLEQQAYHTPSEKVPGNDIVGNHAMALLAYDEYGPILEGSWDTTYGDNGIIRLPWRALENVIDLIVFRKVAGFGSDFHTRFFSDRETSRAQINAMLANPQSVIDMCLETDTTEFDLECVMEWPDGAVRSYAAEHPEFNWTGWL